jgi:hypothetical protein
MSKQDAASLPLEDWMVWLAVRDARLTPAGCRAIRSLLEEKETRLRDAPPDSTLVELPTGFEQV